jgi:hypothetical protein
MSQDEVSNLSIPVAGSNEVVTIPLDELPEEAEDLLDILRAEEAPLALWLDFAKAYLAQVFLCYNTSVSSVFLVRPVVQTLRSSRGLELDP